MLPALDRVPRLCKQPAPETVTPQGALSDLRLMEAVLRRGYAGLDVLARRGIQWAPIFARARSRVRALKGAVKVEALRRLLLDAMGEIPDGHLALFTIGPDGKWRHTSPARHRDAWTSGEASRRQGDRFVDAAGGQLLRCDGHEQLDQLLRPGPGPGGTVLWRPVLLRAGKPSTGLTCHWKKPAGGPAEARTTSWRPLQPAPPARKRGAARPPVLEVRPGEVPWIRLRGFDSRQAEAMARFEETALLARAAAVTVVDLRGNPGGNDTHARNWFKALTNHEFRYPMIHELHSEVTRQGDLNWVGCTLTSRRMDAGGRRHFEQKLVQYRELAAREREGGPFRRWTRRSFSERGKAPSPYGGALVALVDRRCASSCEVFLDYARQLPGTLVVGENSAGVGEIGETREYLLPHSGIWVQAGKKWFQSRAGAKRATEGTGHLPDLWLEGADWPAQVDALTRCLVKPACRDTLRDTLRDSLRNSLRRARLSPAAP